MMHFFHAGYLLLPLAFFFVICVTLLGAWLYKRQRVIVSLAHPKHQKLLVIGYSKVRDWLHVFLRIVGIVALIIALLDPRGKPHEIESIQQSKDVMFVLDISRSMLAEDVQPSRLDLAKNTIKQLVRTHPEFAYGLSVFSTKALTLCPITHETSTFYMFLDDVNHATVTAGGTSLRAALEHIVHSYEQQGVVGHHVCVLFTDGEDFSGDMHDIAQRLIELNIQVCIVGMGTTIGAPIPFYNDKGVRQGHIVDKNGAIVISHRDDAVLTNLAQSLGVEYMPFEDYEDGRLVAWLTEKATMSPVKTTVADYDSYAYRASFIAWCFFVIDWLLP